MKFVQGLVGESACSHLGLEVFEPFLVDQQTGMSCPGKYRIVEGDIEIGHRVVRLFLETFRNVPRRRVAIIAAWLFTCPLLSPRPVRFRYNHFRASSVAHCHTHGRHK